VFATFYTYGHLLTIAFSMVMSLGFAVVKYRLPGERGDLWIVGTYALTGIMGAVDMWLSIHPTVWGARVYFAVVVVVFWQVNLGFHAQFNEALPPARRRGYKIALGFFSVYAAMMLVLLLTGTLDDGQGRALELWGARSMLVSSPPWAIAMMAVVALANVPLCAEMLHREGPRRGERRLVAIPMWGAPLIVIWELSIVAGYNPYLPLGGFFAALLGLQGVLILIERVTTLQHRVNVGGYVIDSRLGQGGMAEVFLAHRQGTGEMKGVVQRVALKRLRHEHATNPSFVQMFLDEAKLVARLSHPNIVRLLDAGREGEDLYLAMELIEGATLSQVLRATRAKRARLSSAVVVEVAMQVCEALDYAHALRGEDGRPLELVHRDISPQNILIDDAAHVKLTDFGIARSTDRTGETQTGMLKGKLSYMAPEQIKGRYDHRADLYALGIVMFEMITGEKPHDTASEATLLYQILEGQLPRLSLLDEAQPALADACRAVLRTDPEARPLKASALRDRLARLRDEAQARSELARWVSVAAELQRLRAQRGEVEHDTIVDRGPDAPTRV
jgi:hypothetical protein